MATVGGVGEVDLVSTANGVANDDGEGNYFAHLWDTAEERHRRRLPRHRPPPRPRRGVVPRPRTST
jgi:hypothetical protein